MCEVDTSSLYKSPLSSIELSEGTLSPSHRHVTSSSTVIGDSGATLNGHTYCMRGNQHFPSLPIDGVHNKSCDTYFIRRWAMDVLVKSYQENIIPYKYIMDNTDYSRRSFITSQDEEYQIKLDISVVSSPSFKEAMTVFQRSAERKSWAADDFKCWLSLTSDFTAILQRVLSGSKHKNTNRYISSSSNEECEENIALIPGNKIKYKSAKSFSARLGQIFKKVKSSSLKGTTGPSTIYNCPFGYYSHTNGFLASPFLLHLARVQQMEINAARVIIESHNCSVSPMKEALSSVWDEDELYRIVDSFQCCTDWVIAIPADSAIPLRKTRKVIDTFLKWHVLVPLAATLENGGRVDRALEMVRTIRSERRAAVGTPNTESIFDNGIDTNDGSVSRVKSKIAEQMRKTEEFSYRIMGRYVSASSTNNCGVDVRFKTDPEYTIQGINRRKLLEKETTINTQNISYRGTGTIMHAPSWHAYGDRIEGEMLLFGRGWGALQGNVVPIVKVEQIKLRMLMDRPQLQDFLRRNAVSMPRSGKKMDPTITVVMLAKSFFMPLPICRGVLSHYGLNHDTSTQALSFISETDPSGHLLQYVTDILITIIGCWNNYDIDPPCESTNVENSGISRDPTHFIYDDKTVTNSPLTKSGPLTKPMGSRNSSPAHTTLNARGLDTIDEINNFVNHTESLLEGIIYNDEKESERITSIGREPSSSQRCQSSLLSKTTDIPQALASLSSSLPRNKKILLNSNVEAHCRDNPWEVQEQYSCQESLPFCVNSNNEVTDTSTVKRLDTCGRASSPNYEVAMSKVKRLCGLNGTHNNFRGLHREVPFSSFEAAVPNGRQVEDYSNFSNTQIHHKTLSSGASSFDNDNQLLSATFLSAPQDRAIRADEEHAFNMFHQQCSLALKQLQLCMNTIHSCIKHTCDKFENISISQRRHSYTIALAIETYIHSQLYSRYIFPVFARMYANEDRKLSQYHNNIMSGCAAKEYGEGYSDHYRAGYTRHISPVLFGASEDLSLFPTAKYCSIINSITEDSPSCPYEKLQKMRVLFLQVSSDAEAMVRDIRDRRTKPISSVHNSDDTCDRGAQLRVGDTERRESGICVDDMVALLSTILVACPCTLLYSNIRYLGVCQSEAIDEDSELDYVYVTFRIVIENLLQDCSK